jgi:hypothetical protein
MKWVNVVRSHLIGIMLFGLVSSPLSAGPLNTLAHIPTQAHKVIVDAGSAEALQAIQAAGGTLVVDYGSFSLWKVDAPATSQALNQAGLAYRDDLDQILLRNDVIQTGAGQSAASAPPQALSQTRTSDPQFWMVQFVGPVKAEWLAALQQAGLRVVSYIPNDAYVVWGDGDALSALDTLAAQQSFIQWTGAYHPAYRLAPALQSSQVTKLVDVTVQFYHTDSTDSALSDLLAIGGTVYKAREDVLDFTNISLQLPADQLVAVANWPDVFNVEPWAAPQKMDEAQGQILAGNVISAGGVVTLTGPGYLNWLLSKDFSTNPSSYPVVDVVDDGIDQGLITDVLHPDFHDTGFYTATSRVTYIGNCTSDALGDGQAGHGNLNAGIVAGYNNRAGSPYTDTLGYHLGLGISPYGRVAGTKIFVNAGPYDISKCGYTDEGVVAASYNSGADITSNSWGSSVYGLYDSSSQAYDALTRDASSTTAGNQQMLHIFAAGNKGSSAQTIGSPGTAKNVLTVGATESTRNNGFRDGCNITAAGNADNIAAFSSRGPTTDGRTKPDISAPGTHIQGPASQVSGYTGAEVCNKYYPSGQTLYAMSSGTSHSTPAVAGAVSLLWEYYERVLSPGQRPSPAMLKALLLNAPRYLTGSSANDTLPSNAQGWGDVNLDLLFDGTPRIVVDQSVLFTSTGQTYLTSGAIFDPGKPFHVTLAWTDAPGSTTGNAYVNDLNLQVTANGNVYKGNVFSGANSVTGGSFDARNNVESVFLPAGITGTFQVQVNAANIAGNGVPGSGYSTSQDFALVIYNAGGVQQGHVTDAGTTQPIPAAQVRAVSTDQMSYIAPTDANGAYALAVPGGTYSVTAVAYGYYPNVETAVITASKTITRDYALTWAGLYVISGTVKDADTNMPLSATISISGNLLNPPVVQTGTDPASGFYSFTVAGGQRYQLAVKALFHADGAGVADVDGADVSANFALTPTTQNGGLIGVVRDSGTNAPLSGAVVTVQASGFPSGTTDANGAFQILGIPPGIYDVVAAAQYYSATQISGVQIYTSNLTSQVFLLPHGVLRYAATELQKTLVFGTQVTDALGLVISNTGSGALHVQLEEVAGGMILSDATDPLPWLSESPVTATLGAAQSQAVQLAWDASYAGGISQPGMYYGYLKLNNDDVQSQGISLPVTLTVTAAAQQVYLHGSVYSSGQCDTNYAPITGAGVSITGANGYSTVLSTPADGSYSNYLPAGGSYTLTFTATSHLTATYVVNPADGASFAQNVVLRLNQPCIQVQPAALSAVITHGLSTTLLLQVTNTGALPLNVALHVAPPAGAEVGGPDPYGYMIVSPTLYSFIEISGTGTYTDLVDDGAFNITTTFPLTFYGQVSNTLRVGNNGAILFGARTEGVDAANTSLVSGTTTIDNIIAPLWSDLWFGRGGVWYKEVGAAPNRALVVEWADRQHYLGASGTAGAVTFEVVFYENGNLLFQYQKTSFGYASFDHGADATIGIRGPGAANSVQYAYHQAKLADGAAICIQSFNGPDCATNSWMLPNPLALQSLTGTPATSAIVSVTLDTTQLTQMLLATRTLWLVNNSPMPLVSVPITLRTDTRHVFVPVVLK